MHTVSWVLSLPASEGRKAETTLSPLFESIGIELRFWAEFSLQCHGLIAVPQGFPSKLLGWQQFKHLPCPLPTYHRADNHTWWRHSAWPAKGLPCKGDTVGNGNTVGTYFRVLNPPLATHHMPISFPHAALSTRHPQPRWCYSETAFLACSRRTEQGFSEFQLARFPS